MEAETPAAAAPHKLLARLLALAGALAIALLVFAVLELGLRLTGLGSPPLGFESGLKYQRVYLPAFEPGALADGSEVLATVDPRLAYQWVEPKKPPGSLRIFCFGGSATAGLGFSPNVTFPRELERLLAAADPEVPIDVINLGMVALPSSGVSLLVRNVCESFEPDLLVVYSGNNEFLEVHSEAYFQATASLTKKVVRAIERTNMCGLIRGYGGARPTITTRDLAANDQRVNHMQMLEKVRLSPEQELAVLDKYEVNLRAIASAAHDAGVPLLLSNVAVNTEWWAMQDPDLDWIGALLPSGADPSSAESLELALEHARTRFDDPELSDSHERHLWVFRQAQVLDLLDRRTEANAAYQLALALDPHQRRATQAHAERVARVCAETDAVLFDAIASLSQRDADGRIGFDAFYDYVHFTPRGALDLAEDLFDAIQALGLAPVARPADAHTFAAAERARLAGLEQDDLAVERWCGVTFDPARFHERDLWKYDRALDELDARLARDPRDARALAYRGNAHFFEVAGLEAAEADYRAALAIEELPEVRDNLELLLGARRFVAE